MDVALVVLDGVIGVNIIVAGTILGLCGIMFLWLLLILSLLRAKFK